MSAGICDAACAQASVTNALHGSLAKDSRADLSPNRLKDVAISRHDPDGPVAVLGGDPSLPDVFSLGSGRLTIALIIGTSASR
jgi:hypothetical protein